VHYCQGYEGDIPQLAEALWWIESVYQLQGLAHITISPFLAKRLKERFDISPHVIPYGVCEDLYRPAPEPRATVDPLRIALVGPWGIGWKDIPTGVRAARMVHERGLPIQLVRISPAPMTEDEHQAHGDLPVEWHEKLEQAQMPDVYRSCDLFLGTSSGGAEGFFLPAMEAMSCGLPVILTDIACFRQYKSPADYCTFVPVHDAEGFALEIERLATSTTARQELRDRSLDVATLHTFARHSCALEECFQSLVPAGKALSEGAEAYDPRATLRDGLMDRIAMVQRLLAHAGAPGIDLSVAEQVLRCALALDPRSVAGWFRLGQVLSLQGDGQRALDAIQSGLDVDAESAPLHRLQGLVHFELGAYESAARSLDAAITLRHPGASILLERGIAQFECGRTTEAEESIVAASTIGSFDQRATHLHAQLQSILHSNPSSLVHQT